MPAKKSKLPFEVDVGENVCVVGLRGTGKSEVCKQVILNAPEPVKVAWDPVVVGGVGQYDALPGVQTYHPTFPWADQELDRIAYALYHGGDSARLVLEEGEQVAPEKGSDLPENLKLYAYVGRNLGHSYVLNVRRLAAVDKDLCNQIDWWVIMKPDPGDYQYLRARFGAEMKPYLEAMRKWTKDPRQGGGNMLVYRDGEFQVHPPLRL